MFVSGSDGLRAFDVATETWADAVPVPDRAWPYVLVSVADELWLVAEVNGEGTIYRFNG